MLRTLDIVLIGVMTVAATITYTIKHHAELKLEEVRKIETEIRLEKDTIDLLRADWALLTQPNRLQRLITVYENELQLKPTESTQLAQPMELPRLKAELTPEEIEAGDKARAAAIAANALGPVEEIRDVAKIAPDKDIKKQASTKKKKPVDTDQIETGSVKR